MTESEYHQLIQLFNRALFQSDPMGTCCQENDLHDEYSPIAVIATGYVQEGKDHRSALHVALEYAFGDLVTGQKVDEVMQQLTQLNPRLQ